jgi:hypothetical protein
MIDYGGAVGGALSGAQIGSMVPGIGTLLGGIGGGLMGMFGGKKAQGPTFTEYNPDKAYRESMTPLWNQSVGYDQDVMRNLQLGQLNPGMEAALQAMQNERRRRLMQEYYGNQGQRGQSAYGRAFEAGALGGLSGRQTQAQAGQLRNEYYDKSQAIDDLINQTRFSGLQSLQNQYGAGGAATAYKRATDTPYMLGPSQMTSQGTPASNPMVTALSGMAGSMGGFGSGSMMPSWWGKSPEITMANSRLVGQYNSGNLDYLNT